VRDCKLKNVCFPTLHRLYLAHQTTQTGYSMFKFAIDTNGNRVLKIKVAGFRGFSIQTNGNLPLSHRMLSHNMKNQQQYDTIKNEVLKFVSLYGTAQQKKIVNLL